MVSAYLCRWYPCITLAVPLGVRVPPAEDRGPIAFRCHWVQRPRFYCTILYHRHECRGRWRGRGSFWSRLRETWDEGSIYLAARDDRRQIEGREPSAFLRKETISGWKVATAAKKDNDRPPLHRFALEHFPPAGATCTCTKLSLWAVLCCNQCKWWIQSANLHATTACVCGCRWMRRCKVCFRISDRDNYNHHRRRHPKHTSDNKKPFSYGRQRWVLMRVCSLFTMIYIPLGIQVCPPDIF